MIRPSKFLLLLLVLLVHSLLAEVVEVQILQTSDIHSTLSREKNRNGSWLQLASRAQELLDRYGRQNCLLIDCGDTIQGTLVGAISRGAAGIIPLRTLKYDVWVPGNHEFDFGFKRFMELAEPLREIILCGNLQPIQEKPFTSWKCFTRNRAKIAVVGMTASYLRHWLGEAFGDSCRVSSAVDSIAAIMPEILQEKPDCIILAIHQGWQERPDPRQVNEVTAIVEKFPEFDLVLGGHTHRPFPGHKISSRTWYLQPGFGGNYLGVASISIDNEKHQVLAISSYLSDIQEGTPIYPPLQRDLRYWLEREQQARLEPIAPAPAQDIVSTGRPGINCPASELFCAALAEAAGTTLALHGTLSTYHLKAGKALTENDLFAFVPYENTIVTARLTVSQLEEIILEQWSKRDQYTFCGFWGAEVKISSDGQSAQLDLPDSSQPLLLALNNFTAAGSGRYPKLTAILKLPQAQTTDTGISTREAIRAYLQKHPGLNLTPRQWLKTENSR